MGDRLSIGNVTQTVTGAGAVGQVGHNTAHVAQSEAAAQWTDAIEQARSEGGDYAAHSTAELKMLAELGTLREAGQTKARSALGAIKAQAPKALRVVAGLLKGGVTGAAATLATLAADALEAD